MLNQICTDMGRAPVRTIHPGLMTALQAHHWPGNLRQLHSMLRTACALLDQEDTALDWHHLPQEMRLDLLPPKASTEGTAPLAASASNCAPATATALVGEANLRRLSSHTIQQVIAATGGNMSEAARRLGISRNTLYRRLKQDQKTDEELRHQPGSSQAIR
jgi:DNA-binding NtrC family response regulator